MDRLVKNMYFLVLSNSITKLTTRLFPSNGAIHAMGGIKLAGTIRSSCGTGYPKKRDLGSHALVYLLAGDGEYEDSLGTRQRVQAGDLIWLFPGVPHRYGPGTSSRWDEIYLVFEGPLIDLWRQQKILTPERPIWRLEPVDFWFGRLEAATLTSSSKGWENAFYQLSQFQLLVADMLLASRDKENNSSDRDWLAQACRLLKAEGASVPSLDGVARLVGMSYEDFRKKFTQRMGMAPGKYRQARLIERACVLLMRRSRSHKEIAEQLGFCDEFHFSKAFRKQMGFSPHAFRLKTLGQIRQG